MIITQAKRTGSQCVSVTLPELLHLSKNAREFSLSALRVRSPQSGQHLSRLLGRGMEFAESRRYQSGDDIRNIDWRVTARTGKAHTKLFAVEKERQVLLCVDMRASMFFATRGVFKSVQASLTSAYIAWNAAQNGNRLGGIIFDDTSHCELRPTRGKNGVLRLLQQLVDKANISEKPRGTIGSMEQAIANIEKVASPGSLVFVISDFRNMTPYAYDLLFQVSRHSDLCLGFVYDPLEVSLPKNGYYPVTDGNGELQLNTYDKASLEKYQRQFIERREKVKSLATHRHVHFIEFCTEDDCLDILRKHFSRHSR